MNSWFNGPMESSGRLLVSRSALLHNVSQLYQQAGVPLLAVIKANAYGHGAQLVSTLLEGVSPVWGYGVATPSEAVELVSWGCRKPVVLLAPTRAGTAQELVQLGVHLSVGHLEELEGLPAGSPIHLKVDTGLHRYGCQPQELPALFARARTLSLQVEGVYSHLAGPFANGSGAAQRETFDQAVAFLPSWVRRHLYCTESILEYGAAQYQLARPGIGLFGAVEPGDHGLLPVGLLEGRVALVRDMPKGSRVSYDGSWVAPHDARLAIVQVGYADGYPLQAEHRAQIWLGQRLCPVVGYFGMDAIWVDITHTPGPLEDWAELIGPHLPVTTVANWAQTIPAQLLPGLACRLERRLVD